MSSESLAIFRKSASADLQKLADEHLNHELVPHPIQTFHKNCLSRFNLLTNPYSLNEADRDALKSAGSKLQTHVLVGSLLGLGLGAALAFRVRQNRLKFFQAFRTAQKPTHVKFADGREGKFFRPRHPYLPSREALTNKILQKQSQTLRLYWNPPDSVISQRILSFLLRGFF